MATTSAPATAGRTANRKLTADPKRHAYATHAAQVTCPAACPLRDAGCYAEHGPQGIHTARLNRAAGDASPLEVARAEARAIDALPGDAAAVIMRVHVVGDAPTDACAQVIAAAALRWQARCAAAGAPVPPRVFAYTHAWRTVKRASWGAVSVLASVDSLTDAAAAQARGYATATVTPDQGPRDGKTYTAGGVKLVPCPAATGRAPDCATCGLCMRDGALLARGATIAFPAHGSRARMVRERLGG